MLWLIKKELTANTRYMLIGFLFFFVYAFIFAGNGAGLFMLCLTICVYSIVSTNLVLDERYKIDQLMTTLPLRRRDLVLAKYMLLFVLFMICAALYAVLALGARAAGYGRIPLLTLSDAMLGLFAASVYLGISLPLSYRFGAQSTRYVSLVLFFVAFFLSSQVPKGAEAMAGAGFSGGTMSMILLAAALIINAASFLISNALFARKDL
jgi:ABC-type transport system involved in multi-copper enzyme maturation permease subunit